MNRLDLTNAIIETDKNLSSVGFNVIDDILIERQCETVKDLVKKIMDGLFISIYTAPEQRVFQYKDRIREFTCHINALVSYKLEDMVEHNEKTHDEASQFARNKLGTLLKPLIKLC